MKAKLKFITTLLIAAAFLSGCELNISNQNSSDIQYLDEINYKANDIQVGTKITDYDFIDDQSIQTITTVEDDSSISETRCIKLINKNKSNESVESIHDFQFDNLEIITKKNSDIINTVKLTLFNCNKISKSDFINCSEQMFGSLSSEIKEYRNNNLWPLPNSDEDEITEDAYNAKFSYSIIYSDRTDDNTLCTIEYHEISDCELCPSGHHSILSIEYSLDD